ncbi:putative tartrate transporter [compost metagenome]
MITAIANIGGLASTYLVGWIKDLTHSADMGLYVVAGVLVAGGIVTLAAVPARLVNK